MHTIVSKLCKSDELNYCKLVRGHFYIITSSDNEYHKVGDLCYISMGGTTPTLQDLTSKNWTQLDSTTSRNLLFREVNVTLTIESFVN